MNEPIRTNRPFKERVVEGFDRSRLRQEALRAKRGRFHKLRKRYGTMVLGASLAVGGLGVPLQMGRTAPDLSGAQEIARQVAGGVDAAIPFGSTVQEGFGLSDQQVELITENAREEFFNSEVPFGSLIYSEAKKNNLAPELVAAVVQTESSWRPTAKSGVGASGLMQLMPKTGKWMGAKNLMNPAENVRAGTKYLKYLNERFDGDPTMVLAAYNAGEGNVKRYGGVPPFKETKNYVKKVSTAQKEFEERVSGVVAERLESGTAVALTR